MATVYRGILQGVDGFEREVAIKVLHPHLADEEQYVAMFHDEARLASRLAHPVLVPVTDLGEADGIHYMVMDLLKGENLGALYKHFTEKKKSFPVEYALWVIAHTLDGLAYAHELTNTKGDPCGIIHRDVSPQNIFISRAGGVRLVDFGIAREQAGAGMTQAGIVKGTVPYMAPEQARGEPVDQRIDIFAAGMVLYELITGRIPLEETEATAQREAIAEGRITPDFKSIDAPIRAILEKAMAVDRDERYERAADFAEDARRLLDEICPSLDPLRLGAMVRRKKPAPTEPKKRRRKAKKKATQSTGSQRPQPTRSGPVRNRTEWNGGQVVGFFAAALMLAGLIYTFVSGGP